MTDRQILLVKNSWSYVITDAEGAGQVFYERLFEVAPELRQLFKTDPKDQSQKLMSMMTLIVTKLQHPEELGIGMTLLAQRHEKYGAEPRHYAIVGDCLVSTIKHILAHRWNRETEDAWRAAYQFIADTMMKHQKTHTSTSIL